MNVWIICKYGSVPQDGYPTRHYFFAKYLAKNNVNVTLITSASSVIYKKVKGFAEVKNIDGFKHILLKGPKIKLGINLKRIYSWFLFEYRLLRAPKKLKLQKPDIVFVSSLSLLTVLSGIKFKKKFNAKLIFEIRDIWPLSLIDLHGFSPNHPITKILAWIEKKGYEKSDYLVSPLPLFYKHAEKILGHKVNFLYLPQGYDPEYYKETEPLPENIANQLPKDKFIAGFAGGIGKYQALHLAVEAARLLKNNKNIFIAIIGDGPLKQQLIQQSKDLDNIVFLPKVKKTQVPDFLNKIDVALHLWLKRDIFKYGVFPNKWIDYMLAAKPIITAFDGYGGDLQKANCAKFIPAEDPKALADAIVEFSQMPKDKLIQMGLNGKKYLEQNLTYEKITNSLLNIMKQLTNS